MADYRVTDTELTSIANAIRTKGATQVSLEFPTGFVTAIENIPTGHEPVLQSKTVTENGTVTPDAGYDGLSEVVVNVSGGGGDDHYFKRLTPIHTDLVGGYVNVGKWYTGDTTARSDVYAVENSKRYLIMLGATVGNRFRVALFHEDPGAVQRNLSGLIVGTDIDDSNVSYRIISAGSVSKLILVDNPSYLFLTIGKTNQGVNGIETYVFEALF